MSYGSYGNYGYQQPSVNINRYYAPPRNLNLPTTYNNQYLNYSTNSYQTQKHVYNVYDHTVNNHYVAHQPIYNYMPSSEDRYYHYTLPPKVNYMPNQYKGATHYGSYQPPKVNFTYNQGYGSNYGSYGSNSYGNSYSSSYSNSYGSSYGGSNSYNRYGQNAYQGAYG